MAALSERLNTPISTAELERRWALVRKGMEERGIDVLVMQNNNDFMGGYVKYLTDLPATNGYPVTLIFPKDDGMTMIGQGPFGHDKPVPLEGNGMLRGVKRQLGVPSYHTAHYTGDYDAELAVKALAPYKGAKVGLLATASIPHMLVEYLKKNAPTNEDFVNASDFVDDIRAIKSQEEIELMRDSRIAAGRADGGCICCGQAGYAGSGCDGCRAALRNIARQRTGLVHVRVRVLSARQLSWCRRISRRAQCRRATNSRCFAKMQALAACIRNWAAPACWARLARK